MSTYLLLQLVSGLFLFLVLFPFLDHLFLIPLKNAKTPKPLLIQLHQPIINIQNIPLILIQPLRIPVRATLRIPILLSLRILLERLKRLFQILPHIRDPHVLGARVPFTTDTNDPNLIRDMYRFFKTWVRAPKDGDGVIPVVVVVAHVAVFGFAFEPVVLEDSAERVVGFSFLFLGLWVGFGGEVVVWVKREEEGALCWSLARTVLVAEGLSEGGLEDLVQSRKSEVWWDDKDADYARVTYSIEGDV